MPATEPPTNFAAERRSRLRQRVADEGLDGFIVSSEVNVGYLTEFTGDSTYLLIGGDRTLLVSDGRYEEQLAEECPDVERHIRPPEVSLVDATARVIAGLGWRLVGFESEHTSVATAQRLADAAKTVQWKPCTGFVERLRMKKDPSEIAQIREAIAMAERAFDEWRRSLQPQDSEKSLGDRVEMLLRQAGARSSSFPPIVAVGERAALPHAPLTDQVIGDAELVLVDWGACGRAYRSDLTRVVPLRRISPKLEQVYAVVLQAQQRAVAAIRPGVVGRDVDAAARASLDQAGFSRYFRHSLGHGIGREVHEGPFLRPNSTTILETGMVVTVEPGVYLPQWGGVRIEDDVLVTSDGCEVLSRLTRDPSELVIRW